MSLAYHAGTEAYANGFDRSTNPHALHTAEHNDWAAGWMWAFRNEMR